VKLWFRLSMYRTFGILVIIAIVGIVWISTLPEESLSREARFLIQLVLVGIPLVLPFLPLLAPLKPRDSAIDDWRTALTHNVRRNWIDGVLADALRDAQFDIYVETKPEQAGRAADYAEYRLPTNTHTINETRKVNIFENVLRLLLHRQNVKSESIHTTAEAVTKAFHDVKGKLLILGEPGSGKTVLLLQLAQRLLEEAEKTTGKIPEKPVPVVFNLSSWAIERKPMIDWLAGELRRNYEVSTEKFARQLIDTDKLIFLLDGLDEVAETHRDDCLNEINSFITKERQLVVCSRIMEYSALGGKLNMHTAIEVQPLSLNEFEAVLRDHIPSADSVEQIMELLNSDDAVRRKAVKPLFANILIATYRDEKPFTKALKQGDTLSRVRTLLIEPYVTRQLQAAPENARFSNLDTRRYLEWLGWQMQYKERTTFYVEELQHDWLLKTDHEYIHNLIVLIIPIVLGTLCCLMYGWEAALFAFGMSAGTLYENPINLFKRLGSPLRKLNSEENAKLIQTSFMMIVMSIFVLILSRDISLFVFFLIFGMIFVFIFWQMSAFNDTTQISEVTKINQGLEQTLISGLAIGQGVTLTFLLFLSIGRLVMGNASYLLNELPAIVFTGVIFSFGMGFGDVTRHLSLRFLLWRVEKVAPRRFDHFLYHARDLRLMRQVGGGFIFIHRYIQEYFAAEWEKKHPELVSEKPAAETSG
jgi:DNA replication protein DnaC